mgnify:FL=1
MENIKVVIEDIKNLRRKAKEMLETANRLEKSVFAIKQSARKEKDINKRREYQDATEDINLQIRGLRKDIENLEDSDLFRDKIKIQKHTK